MVETDLKLSLTNKTGINTKPDIESKRHFYIFVKCISYLI